MEYTSGASSWRAVFRRTGSALRPRRRRPTWWSLLVPLVALIAGLLFTTSARTAAGTALRDDRTPQLTTLIDDRTRQIAQAESQRSSLSNQVQALTNQAAQGNSAVQQQRDRATQEQSGAGLTALHGPGLTVSLDDAPRLPGGALPRGATADDVVVHQQDVQAVVNAMWAGGADAMTIMGVRVISTTAVRCVGNTLLLQGRVYSPPFVITAIGNQDAIRAALDASPAVSLFRDAALAWGLRYDVSTEGDVTVPAYGGSTSLQYAQVP